MIRKASFWFRHWELFPLLVVSRVGCCFFSEYVSWAWWLIWRYGIQSGLYEVGDQDVSRLEHVRRALTLISGYYARGSSWQDMDYGLINIGYTDAAREEYSSP